MSYKNSLKTIFLKIADVLPENIGYMLYHAIQKRLTGSVQSKIDANEKTYLKAIDILTNFEGVANKNILEIGSGWMPIMPYFFKQLGKAGNSYTYDINEHYDNVYIDELNSIFENNYGLTDKNSFKGKYNFPEFVKYFPNSNVITSELANGIDIIFSRFVLEHVTPSDLKAMHERFYNQYDENTMILHFISPSDHRAYSDKSISHYDFLQYSQKEWDNIQTKFDYHNRLRLPQYLDVFSKAGFEIIHLEYDKVNPSSEKYQKFQKLKIHKDFHACSEEELLAGSINVLLRKKIG